MKYPGAIVACWWVLAGMAAAEVTGPTGVAPRIAVVSDDSDKDLAALVGVELSSNPAIALVERDDLAKVGEEAKLQQLASSDATALGKLVGADGLVFLDKRSDGSHVRFTAVNLGYALFDEALPDASDPAQAAKAISHLISVDVAKLKLDPAKAIPISILNLRADVPTTNATKVERDLTLLLESRLAAVPEFVVLERRHAWSLGFEHSLEVPSVPLLEGAVVLDGTLTINGANEGDIAAHLRLRDPVSKQEKSLEAAGKADDLAALVEAMARQIIQAVGTHATASTWQPQAEAREYLHEGIWAWEHDQPQTAVEALDSAELLGETAPDLLAARIEALCQMAVPDLNPTEIQFIGDSNAMLIVYMHANTIHYYTPLLPLADRLATVRRAMADLDVYGEPSGLRSYHLQFLDPKWQHVVQLSFSKNFVIHAASNVLAEMDRQNDPETGAFREEVRQMAGFDPVNGKLPDDKGDGAFFADEWAHSLEEELAYYRAVLTAPGTENQFKAVFLKERFVNERGAVFCPRFIPDPAEQKKALVQFAQSLEQTPEGKLAGLFILSNNEDRTLSETSYAAFLDELASQRVELVKSNELFAHCLAAYEIHARSDTTWVKTGAHAVPILRYFLTQSSAWDIRTLQVLWLPASFPPADAPAIWSEFKAYKARVLDPHSPMAGYAFQEDAMFGALESDYALAFPGSVEAPKNPLSVTRFWQPCTQGDAPFFCIRACETHGNTMLVDGVSRGQFGTIYVLHMPDFEGAPIVLPGDVFPFDLAQTDEAIYVTGFTREGDSHAANTPLHWHLYRYDLAQHAWDQQDLSLDFCSPVVIRGQLYLRTSGGGSHGAIARYDWATRTLTLLASDRRRPAQSQFDDRTGYQVLSLFPGLNNTVGTNIDFRCFTIQDSPGNWPQVIPGFEAERAALLGSTTLIENYRQTICTLIDPAKHQPEIILAPPDQPIPPALAAYGPARWKLDATDILKFFDAAKGAHGGAMYALIRHTTAPAHFELFWLDPARREPVHIPLHFEMDPSTQALLQKVSGRPVNSENSMNPDMDSFPLQMVTVDAGLCFYHPSTGIWFLPYSDIEAWLKAHPSSS